MPHDTGDGIPAHCCVAMVTGVGDLRSQFIVITCPTGVHYVTRVKAGLSWFFYGEWRECVLLDKDKAQLIWNITKLNLFVIIFHYLFIW